MRARISLFEQSPETQRSSSTAVYPQRKPISTALLYASSICVQRSHRPTFPSQSIVSINFTSRIVVSSSTQLLSNTTVLPFDINEPVQRRLSARYKPIINVSSFHRSRTNLDVTVKCTKRFVQRSLWSIVLIELSLIPRSKFRSYGVIYGQN